MVAWGGIHQMSWKLAARMKWTIWLCDRRAWECATDWETDDSAWSSWRSIQGAGVWRWRELPAISGWWFAWLHMEIEACWALVSENWHSSVRLFSSHCLQFLSLASMQFTHQNTSFSQLLMHLTEQLCISHYDKLSVQKPVKHSKLYVTKPAKSNQLPQHILHWVKVFRHNTEDTRGLTWYAPKNIIEKVIWHLKQVITVILRCVYDIFDAWCFIWQQMCGTVFGFWEFKQNK